MPYMDAVKAKLQNAGLKTDDMKSNMKDASLKKKFFSEFVGTFMVVFTVGLTRTAGVEDPALSVFAPMAIGSVLTVMVYALGPISGGHFNPAVTFAVWVQKEINVTEAVLYMFFQLVAGLLAGLFANLLYFSGSTSAIILKPTDATFIIGAPLVEFFYTFLICFVFLNVAVSRKTKGNHFYGAAIGFSMMAGLYGGGAVSTGVFNPAIAVGINFMSGTTFDFMEMVYLPIYMACELAGGFVAVIFFHIARPEEKKEDEHAYGPTKLANKLKGYLDPEDTSEMIGTLMITYTMGLNGLAPNNPGGVWSTAACLMSMFYAVGDVSGGLFNPALTVACLARFFKTGQGFGKDKLTDPKVAPKEGPKYLLAQFIGGCLGGLAVFGTYFAHAVKAGWMDHPPAVAVGPKHGHNIHQAFFAEVLGTFLLCFVFLCIVTVKAPLQEYSAYAIGSCIIGVGYAFAPLSGGLVNPAVVMGSSLFHNVDFFYNLGPILMLLAEVLGGVLAAVIFKFVTHPHEYEQAEIPSGSNKEGLLAA